MHRREAIFDQLEAEPPDRESWSVYADLLLERADPWAEIVARSLQGRSSVERLEAARKRRDPAYWPPEILDWQHMPPVHTWRMGLWRELEFVTGDMDRQKADMFARMVAHPAARLLRRLRLRCTTRVEASGLEALGQLEAPLALDLGSAKVDDLDVLARIPPLRELRIGRDHSWHLGELPQLEAFAADCPRTMAEVRGLSLYRSLRDLDLSLHETVRLDLSALADLPLRRLMLRVSLLEVRPDWESIAQCAGLSRLEMMGGVDGEVVDLRALVLLPALRHLVLWHLHDALRRVPDAVCERLTGLAVVGPDPDIEQNLARCPGLEDLHLGISRMTPGSLAALPKLRSLSLDRLHQAPDLDGLALDRVELGEQNFPEGFVDAIARMGSLRELSFAEIHPKERRSLLLLRSLPGFEVLDLSRARGLPTALRWRFEGEEELELAIEALAHG
jgi:hypothetical protein